SCTNTSRASTALNGSAAATTLTNLVRGIPNRCLSAATSCLYGLTEAAVLAAGYAPAIGFLHTGKPLSFVYDVADIFKFETVVPAAFKVAGGAQRGVRACAADPVGTVRRECRDMFRKTKLLERLIPAIEEMLAS